MSWTNKLLSHCAVGIALLGASAVAAETIVVRSSGPSAKAYPPGKNLPDNGKVNLKAGDQVTILDGRGTRVLKGPGSFSTTASSGAVAGSAVTQLLRNTGTRQARTGAVRGAAGPTVARSPNLWYVDVSKSGTFCVAEPSAVSLWRGAVGAATEYSLTRVSDGKSSPVDFRVGQSVRGWPTEELPVAQGAQYRLSGGGMASPTTIRFVELGPNPQGLEGTAAALIRNGCSAQLDLLVETVAIPAAEPQPAG